jgi:hypothetical protein
MFKPSHLRGFPNYAKSLGSFGKLRNFFSSLQNMDTLGKKIKNFFPGCLKICGQFGIGFCPIISGRLYKGWKILNSAQNFALWKNPDAGKKKSGSFGNFISHNTFG